MKNPEASRGQCQGREDRRGDGLRGESQEPRLQTV